MLRPPAWLRTRSIAHLWFVTIHPFEDSNGRIARAVADMALARSEESPDRFYNLRICKIFAAYFAEIMGAILRKPPSGCCCTNSGDSGEGLSMSGR